MKDQSEPKQPTGFVRVVNGSLLGRRGEVLSTKPLAGPHVEEVLIDFGFVLAWMSVDDVEWIDGLKVANIDAEIDL